MLPLPTACFALHIVDVGVDHEFPLEGTALIHRKIRRGTRSFLHESAMTEEEVDRAISIGVVSVDEAVDRGCKLLSFGEMGIANTSTSALWMYYLTDLPLEDVWGVGADLTTKAYSTSSPSSARLWTTIAVLWMPKLYSATSVATRWWSPSGRCSVQQSAAWPSSSMASS